MAISTNGAIIARLAGGLYNTVLSNATYLEVVAQNPSTLADQLYAADFAKKTDADVGKILVANLGLSSLTGLDAWVAAQLTAAGAHKGAKVVELLNGFAQMTADTTYGTYATAFNAKVDAALASSQTTGKAEAKFVETAGVTTPVTSFTLTTGVDTIVGSAGDDTITAPATVATTGAAQTTINSGDSIDGGAGNDTVTLTITGANNNSLAGLTIKGVEKIVYVGSDNLGTGAAAVTAATTAAATAAADLAAVIGANTAAATAAAASQAALDAADAVAAASMTTVALLTTLAAGKAVNGNTDLADAAAAATAYTFTAGTATLADLKAAAAAALKAADGTAITVNATAVARADALAATALLADTGADAAVTAITTATTGSLAKAYAADAAAKAALAGATAAMGVASIAANADATSISIDGKTTSITGLVDTQTVTSSSTAAANTFKYSSKATVANLALSGAKGTYTFADDSTTVPTTGVVTANVTGSTKQTAATQTANASGGSITLIDTLNADADTIKTLNLGLTSDTSLTISGLTKVTKIDGSASTGGLTLTSLSTTLNVTTGAGKDVVTFVPLTDVTSATKATSSLSTGAGNDTITVTVDASSTGTTTVDAGAGDDSVTLAVLGTATVDGGDGKDTINLSNVAFSTGNYNAMKALANFEVLGLTGVIPTADALDASKAAQYSEFTFKQASDSDSFIVKVADTQIINSTKADVNVTAAGYVAKGSTNADGDTATSTAYVGALTVNAKGGGQTGATGADDANALNLTAKASSLTLNVTTVPSTTTPAVTASYVALTGDLKTATVNVTNGVDKMTVAGTDISSTVKIAPTDAATSGAWTNLGNLTSVTFAGTGVAIVDNSDALDTDATKPGTKLATIDASGLAGKVTIAGTTLGNATAGLTWTAGLLAETVKLGSAIDKLNISATTSTYAKMDSITGFSLVLNAAGLMDATSAAKSDDITIGGANATYVKAAAGLSSTSLDAALNALAGRATDLAVFQCAGNTYIFKDASADTTVGVADGDMVIELVGLVDLDALIYVLGNNV